MKAKVGEKDMQLLDLNVNVNGHIIRADCIDGNTNRSLRIAQSALKAMPNFQYLDIKYWKHLYNITLWFIMQVKLRDSKHSIESHALGYSSSFHINIGGL